MYAKAERRTSRKRDNYVMSLLLDDVLFESHVTWGVPINYVSIYLLNLNLRVFLSNRSRGGLSSLVIGFFSLLRDRKSQKERNNNRYIIMIAFDIN